MKRLSRFCTIVFVFVWFFVSCSAIKYVPVEVEKIKMEYVSKVDTTFIKDSVFIKEFTKADTVFLTKEKYKYIYKYKTDTLHRVDTIPVIREVVVPERYVPDYYKKVNGGFWVLISLILMYLAYKLYNITKGFWLGKGR